VGYQHVLAAALTDVRQVRSDAGGPYPGYAPATEPWATLPARAPAAWCTVRTAVDWEVSTAGPNGQLVVFMHSEEPIRGAYVGGPAIP